MANTMTTTTPRKLWQHANPQGTKMWQFMQKVNEKRGLKLEVCSSLLLLWRGRWVPNEPIDHVV
jgi:hypothetical protein